MIAAADLLPAQTYYTFTVERVHARRYVGSLPTSGSKAQDVYYFAGDYDLAYKAYGPDLLTYFATEREAQRALVEALSALHQQQVALLETGEAVVT